MMSECGTEFARKGVYFDVLASFGRIEIEWQGVTSWKGRPTPTTYKICTDR